MIYYRVKKTGRYFLRLQDKKRTNKYGLGRGIFIAGSLGMGSIILNIFLFCIISITKTDEEYCPNN